VPQDYAEAIKWYLKACEQNFADSRNGIWPHVPKWIGMPVRRVGCEALPQSGRAGACWAQYSWLGCTPTVRCAHDDAEAVNWYLKSAGQGEHRAQCNLGFMYAMGREYRGRQGAVKWIASGEQNDAVAQRNLAACTAMGLASLKTIRRLFIGTVKRLTRITQRSGFVSVDVPGGSRVEQISRSPPNCIRRRGARRTWHRRI